MRWYLQYRLSYAAVAELLAERGVRVDPSTAYARAPARAPLYEVAARTWRRAVGGRWSVDETSVTVAGEWCYVYRAIDVLGQIVDGDVSAPHGADDAAACFRRAIAAIGGALATVTTDHAVTDPPALAQVLPEAADEAGKHLQQRVERDHQHLQGRWRGIGGFQSLTGARVLAASHAFLRTPRGGFYDLASPTTRLTKRPALPLVVCSWDVLTATLLRR